MFRLPLSRWVVFFVASAFAATAVDVWHSHHEVMHEQPWPWIPCLFAPAATVLTGLAALIWRAPWLRLVQVIGLMAVIVGVAGFVFHNEDRVLGGPSSEEQGRAALLERLGLSEPAWAQEKGPSAPGSAQHEGPRTWSQRFYDDPQPPLAPLAFAGLGALGFLASAFGVRRLQNPATQSGTQPVSEE